MDKAKETTILDNNVYNLIQATATKLEGLAAYNKYAEDGDQEIWQSLRQTDEEAVRRLLSKLKECGTNGKLEMKGSAASGQAGNSQGSQGGGGMSQEGKSQGSSESQQQRTGQQSPNSPSA